jgi:hypothetical protein
MTKSRGLRPPRKLWTPEQEAMLRSRYADEKTETLAVEIGRDLKSLYAKAKKLGLKKSQEYLDSPVACRLRRGDNVGMEYRFKPGQQVWNKGMKGLKIGGEQTQFKPGHKPHNHVPIGSERFSKEGYLQRKMTDTGYPPKDWVAVHNLLWVEHNGPIPAGHVVSFKDGNKKHISIDNLECISRRDLMKRNTRHNLPKELSDLIALRGALTRQINKRIKNEQPEND